MLWVIPLVLALLCRYCPLTLENILDLVLLLLFIFYYLIFFAFCIQKSLYVMYTTFATFKCLF